MYEFTNERFRLTDVLGREITEIQSRINEAKATEERISILQNYLLNKLSGSRIGFDRTDFAANLIVNANGLCNISDLMNNLYICRRQFERQFLLKVGVSPKHYARIRRISVICREMASKNWNVHDWHQFIHEAGFYDQSHFIREFKSFTGRSPSVYARNNVELKRFLSDD